MKKLLVVVTLSAVLAAASGCHIAECWRWAWNSRFHPERNAPPAQPCVMVDPCVDPCGGTVVSEGTVVSGGGCTSCAAPVVTPGPVVGR